MTKASDKQGRQGGEIKITPAMVEAGALRLQQVLGDYLPNYWLYGLQVAEEVYRVMAAKAPRRGST